MRQVDAVGEGGAALVVDEEERHPVGAVGGRHAEHPGLQELRLSGTGRAADEGVRALRAQVEMERPGTAVTDERPEVPLLLAALLLGTGVARAQTLEVRAGEHDTFSRLATTGLVLMFGLQAAINMMVNVHLMPAKGMTLPFISYGGSSLLSLALGMGFLIALTRRRPRAETMDRFAEWRG